MATILSEKLFAHFEKVFRPHLSSVGLDGRVFTDPAVEVPVEKYIALLEHVARAGQPSIGLSMGRQLDANDLGVLGHAMLAASDVGEMLRTLSTYIYVFAQDNAFRLDVSRDYAVVSYRCLVQNASSVQYDVEFATSGIANLISAGAGRTIIPRYAEFEHTKPGYSAEYFESFHCDTLFERGGNRLHYDRRVLNVPMQSANPRLYEALEFYLKHQLLFRGQDDDLLEKLQHLLSASLNAGVPELGGIARQLGMGERTLQRRLRDGGIVFSELIDQTRRNVALEYVRGTNYRLIDIAQMLGYTDASSFTRACKRWTGMSPRQLRTEATKLPATALQPAR